MLLGNDVVDRKQLAATGKHLDDRFIGRVFTNEESICIKNAGDPTLALWMIWAAKESIFKVMRKLDPELTFSHREFSLAAESILCIQNAGSKEGNFQTQVTLKENEFALILFWNAEYIHCMAGWRRWGVLSAVELNMLTAVTVEELSNSEDTLTEQELDSVHSIESREVRLLAKRLINEHHSLEKPELVRRRALGGLLPPEVLDNGIAAPGIDLSLSHDGRFVAAVVTLEPRPSLSRSFFP